MDINKKTEFLWKLTAIKKFIPTEFNDMMYTSVTDWLRNWEKIWQLQLKLWSGTIKTATINDLKDYFDKAQSFQIKNMLKLYKKTFPLGSTNIPTMHYIPVKGDINWNNSISNDFSNIWREYYRYDLSEDGSGKINS